MSDITLRTASADYGGWKRIEVTHGVEQLAASFAFQVTDRWPGSGAAVRLARGESVEVRVDDETLVNGWIDATPMTYSPRAMAEYTVVGRSRCGDLVDCAADHASGQWRDVTVQQIARDLAAPFGVSVTADTDLGAPIKQFKLERGETVQEAVDRAIGQRALLATDTGAGDMLLTRAGAARAADQIVLGENVIRASAGGSDAGRFSLYRVIGQRSGSNNDFGLDVATPRGEVTDANITRYRPTIVPLSGQVDAAVANDRAAWEAVYRQGRAHEVRYTLQGWRQSSGALWTKNQLVRVVDPVAGYETDMLIATVRYLLGDDGETVELRVMPPSAFEKRPEPPTEVTTTKRRSTVGGMPPGDYTLVEF